MPVALLGGRLQRHRQHTLDRASRACEHKLSHHRKRTGPVESHLPATQQESQRYRQVKPASVFLENGRSEVAKRSLNA
jgi:hypothetical protein